MGGKISRLFCAANPDDDPSADALALALLAYVAAVTIGILAESKNTFVGWSTARKAAYLGTAVVTIALLGVGFMAAGWPLPHRLSKPELSGVCAKLGAILATALLVVAISCKFGQWGCAAGGVSAAVVAFVMAVVWVWAEPEARKAICGGCWS